MRSAIYLSAVTVCAMAYYIAYLLWPNIIPYEISLTQVLPTFFWAIVFTLWDVLEFRRKYPPVKSEKIDSLSLAEGNWKQHVRIAVEGGCSKITAIKLCRSLTSLALKEAKDEIEEMYPLWNKLDKPYSSKENI